MTVKYNISFYFANVWYAMLFLDKLGFKNMCLAVIYALMSLNLE